MRSFVLGLLSIWYASSVFAQTTAPSWTSFVEDQEEGKQSTLPDYSYAGYHFSGDEIPDVSSWTQFNVTDYGAIADDELYDDEAIQATIDAAEASDGPAVVYFPSGKFIVSEDNSVSKWIQVSRDSIVIKGSGSGAGGTEIFMDQMRVQNGHWQFRFQPEQTSVLTVARITEPASRGDFSVFVSDTESLFVGKVIHIYHKSEEFARSHFGDLELSDDWTRLFGSGSGMTMYEPHIITEINGDRVTFSNPIQTDLEELSSAFVIRELTTIQEVGVEDILFTSDWENYGEDFVHHKDDIHDYAWNALEFENVKDAWVRNCEFRSWNQGINVTQSIRVTIENVQISGKKGHASFATRRSYGLLVKDCEDIAGQHHGPNTGYQGVNTVYLRHIMQKDQSIDCHSGQPYATLIDDVQGGDFDQNGGPHESYPHHGQHLTFWNFRHSTTSDKIYDFWPIGRNGFTYANPLFVGFQADTDVTFVNDGLDELNDQMVEPQSLFEAQLELRLTKAAEQPIVSFISPGNAHEFEVGGVLTVIVDAQDPNGIISGVSLYLDDILIREDTSAPYSWGDSQDQDPDLFDMDAGVYKLRIEATDDQGLTDKDSITVSVGSVPNVEFDTPSNNQIVEEGSSVVVTADITDADGQISTVSLYLDDVLIRTLNETPYEWGTDISLDPALFDLVSGEHILTIEATDNDGLLSIETNTILVNAFPIVSFVTPSENQVFDYGANILLSVEAEDTDGDIVSVEMSINGESIREELGAPFEWGERSDSDPELFDFLDGDYIFEAVAYDDLGSKTTVTVNVTVNPEAIPLNTANALNGEVFVFPNPFKDHLILEANQNSISGLQLVDILGRDLSRQLVLEPSDDRVMITFQGTIHAGFYLLRFSQDGVYNTVAVLKQ